MKTIVVTGATSMIGIATINEWLKYDTKIYAVVREKTYKIKNIPQDDKINIVECEVENYSTLPDLINDKCDIFYHFAWKGAGRYEERNSMAYIQAENIQYSLSALNSAYKLGCSIFIGSGSQAEYGHVTEKMSSSTAVNPYQLYGIAKYATGQLLLRQAEIYGMSCIWVRVLSVYGPYDNPSSMIMNTIYKSLRDEEVQFTPAGQVWDYLYCEDAGRAFYLLGMKGKGHKIYCLGSGEQRQLKEYIFDIGEVIGIDFTENIGKIPYPDGCVMMMSADISSLREDVGFEPKISFRDGIQNTIKWICEEIENS